jgi:hypothetical protein
LKVSVYYTWRYIVVIWFCKSLQLNDIVSTKTVRKNEQWQLSNCSWMNNIEFKMFTWIRVIYFEETPIPFD